MIGVLELEEKQEIHDPHAFLVDPHLATRPPSPLEMKLLTHLRIEISGKSLAARMRSESFWRETSRRTISGALHKLVKRGWIRRRRQEGIEVRDMRLRLFVVTVAGMEALAKGFRKYDFGKEEGR